MNTEVWGLSDWDESTTLVIVPTYREVLNVRRLAEALMALEPRVDLLVVDDNSPDGTGEEVRRLGAEYPGRIHLLVREKKTGIGDAYRAGFAWGLEHSYSYMVQMDADFSHPPASVPELVAQLDSGYDVAVGSRYVPGGKTVHWKLRRRLLSRLGNFYIHKVLGVHPKDTTAGFKAFTARAVKEIGLLESTATGYTFQIENAWRADRAGLRVTEVPITFTDREFGQSKMEGAIIKEALLQPLKWRWDEARGREHPRSVGELCHRQ